MRMASGAVVTGLLSRVRRIYSESASALAITLQAKCLPHVPVLCAASHGALLTNVLKSLRVGHAHGR
jgi:hypothetical protein